MRISDERYRRDLRRLQVAWQMILLGARTVAVPLARSPTIVQEPSRTDLLKRIGGKIRSTLAHSRYGNAKHGCVSSAQYWAKAPQFPADPRGCFARTGHSARRNPARPTPMVLAGLAAAGLHEAPEPPL